jgi:phosphatidylinositol 4-kinase
MIVRRQHQAYDQLAPHFRLVQFLTSHFNATRLGSPEIQRVYYRLMHVTLDAMTNVMDHPLGRETHFHIVLLALRILQFGVDMNPSDKWRLKDSILSAALSWFCSAPKFVKSRPKVLYLVLT